MRVLLSRLKHSSGKQGGSILTKGMANRLRM